MMNALRFFFILFLMALVVPKVAAVDYVWPLEAERALTSTFCEYRPGHFHSGIDLKTWGQVGLKVYAVDDGYVWRVKVSPWGSGRALYLRLADGRCAAYFHLSEYAPCVQPLVEQEQERLGRYSIDRTFEPWEVPVSRGQVVALSGESGTGGPHLHFEIRDSLNRPLNPLTNGFWVGDTVAPTISALSLTPLTAGAAVQGGHQPLIIPCGTAEAGHCRAGEPVTIWGPVGIGVKAHDRADGAGNPLAVYGIDLYVDDRLAFRTQYDRFDFQQTNQVDLDRDYALLQAGQGQFQRLYPAAGNELPFYAGGSGDVRPDPADLTCSNGQEWSLLPGRHAVRVLGMDAAGNQAVAELEVLVNRPPSIEEVRGYSRSGLWRVEAEVRDGDDGVRLARFSYSTDSGRTWRPMGTDSLNDPPGIYEVKASLDVSGPVLCRAEALDHSGLWSPPHISSIPEAGIETSGGWGSIQLESIFHPSFVEWTITAEEPLLAMPRGTVTCQGGKTVELDLVRLELNRFAAVHSFEPDVAGRVVLTIETADPWDAIEPCQWDFDVTSVTRERGGCVAAASGKARAHFGPGGTFGTFVARVEGQALAEPPFLPRRSQAYRFHPAGVPFDEGATVSLSYDAAGGRLERTGLYCHKGDENWSFVGADIDSVTGTVSAQVHSFGCFALLEDTLVPEIWGLRPRDGSQVRAGATVLFARVRDLGSGIGREDDLVMELDGRRVISEYDPEGQWLKHTTKTSLLPGPHALRVRVTDRAGNTMTRDSRFIVVR